MQRCSAFTTRKWHSRGRSSEVTTRRSPRKKQSCFGSKRLVYVFVRVVRVRASQSSKVWLLPTLPPLLSCRLIGCYSFSNKSAPVVFSLGGGGFRREERGSFAPVGIEGGGGGASTIGGYVVGVARFSNLSSFEFLLWREQMLGTRVVTTIYRLRPVTIVALWT